MGEATADYLDHSLPVALAGVLAGLLMVMGLVIQVRMPRYSAVTYWFAVVSVAIFGTMAADGLHVELGLPYLVTSGFCALLLLLIFSGWWTSEGTLSIHTVYNARREAFYWLAVMATFALGTATGDLTATTFGIGYLGSALLFAVLIAIPALAYRLWPAWSVLTFWVAYTLTRPLGASIADWLGFPKAVGGMGWGHGTVSVCFTLPIVAAVFLMALTGWDRPEEEPSPQPVGGARP